MNAINLLIDMFSGLSTLFHRIYSNVYYWVWPFNESATLFYDVSRGFADVAWGLYGFNFWLSGQIEQLRTKLDKWQVRDEIRGWLAGIEDAIDWWHDWARWVDQQIDDAWDTLYLTIKGWIDAAVEGLAPLLAAWDNFWTIIFPTLITFAWLGEWFDDRIADIQGLIDSAFTLREGLWAGWQDWQGDVVEFFSDPLEWLYIKMDEWFERFW